MEWDFLFKTLDAFKHCILTYRHVLVIMDIIKKKQHLYRSIRQGCPISALLFLLVAELIAISIREDNNITSIIVRDTCYKISLMADDTTLIANIESLIQAFY